MVKIRIIKNIIVNISGQKEATQGDTVSVREETAAHLVEELKVAEYLKPVVKPEKQTKQVKKQAKTDEGQQ
jgi:hypothetical protein